MIQAMGDELLIIGLTNDDIRLLKEHKAIMVQGHKGEGLNTAKDIYITVNCDMVLTQLLGSEPRRKEYIARIEDASDIVSKPASQLFGLEKAGTKEKSVREKVIELRREGLSQAEIAAELDVNKSTVSRHVKKAKENGLLE